MNMENGQGKRTSWGRPSTFATFLIWVAVIGAASAAHWRALDLAFALAWLGFLIVGSFVVLWRGWKHRAEPGAAKLGQLAAMPRSWRRWMLGESKDEDVR
jgi:hypothetical protein